jgi:hypothetical protein
MGISSGGKEQLCAGAAALKSPPPEVDEMIMIHIPRLQHFVCTKCKSQGDDPIEFGRRGKLVAVVEKVLIDYGIQLHPDRKMRKYIV